MCSTCVSCALWNVSCKQKKRIRKVHSYFGRKVQDRIFFSVRIQLEQVGYSFRAGLNDRICKNSRTINTCITVLDLERKYHNTSRGNNVIIWEMRLPIWPTCRIWKNSIGKVCNDIIFYLSPERIFSPCGSNLVEYMIYEKFKHLVITF